MEHKQTVTEVKESRLSVKQKVLFGMGDYLNTITYGRSAPSSWPS